MLMDRLGILGLLVSVFPFSAQAQQEVQIDETPMVFEVKEDCIHSDKCEYVALGNGAITQQSLQEFKEFVEKNPEVSKMYLHSQGGHLVSALKLGLMIRLIGMDTAMTGKMRCLSACAYTFMGGVERKMNEGAVIGVHRFYSESGQATEEDGQVMSAHMVKFVSSMGVSTDILELASQSGRNEYTTIDQSRARDLNLDNHGFNQVSWNISPSDDGMPVMKASGQSFGSDRLVSVSLERSSRTVNVAVAIKEPAFNSEYRMKQELTNATLFICRHSSEGKVDEKKCIFGETKGGWVSAQKGEHAVLFSVPVKEFRKLIEGQSDDGLSIVVFGGPTQRSRVAMLNTRAAGLRGGFKALD